MMSEKSEKQAAFQKLLASDIPRFDLDMDGSMDEFPDGRWVRYEDHCKTVAAPSASKEDA